MTKPSKCGGVMSEIFFKKKLYIPRKKQGSYKTKLCPSGFWYDFKI